MKAEIYAKTGCPWKENIHWYDTIDSTNTQAKRLAKAGAPQGTVLIADRQTAGRGRMGRQFDSMPGGGVYLSVILRPACPPDQLMHLTCAAGTAMCDAVEAVTGMRPGIKWINDLVLENRKLGGILTELSVDNGLTEFAVIGIGINCNRAEFPAELQQIATSLSADRAALAGAMIDALHKMNSRLLEKSAVMARYRKDCITLGKAVKIHRAEGVLIGTAVDLDTDGGLIVTLDDGSTVTVSAGEVSVRGLYGYL